MTSCARADLETKFNYCEKERDLAEKTLEICDNSLVNCKEINGLLKEQIAIQKDINVVQTKEVATQKKEIEDLKDSSTIGKVIFGTIGFVIGIFLHIPLPFH